jgi:hypothetical protein
MEFIKVGKDKWLIKASNGRLISEKEKLQLENEELIIKDFKSNECQGKTTKKIAKNKKKIKELETAPIKEEVADDIIKETDSTI